MFWRSLGSFFWDCSQPILGLDLLPTQIFLWEQELRGEREPQREISASLDPGLENFALSSNLEKSRSLGWARASFWVAQLRMHASPKTEMPVLRELCLGWEGSWSSAWCWEWAVPTSKAAFGLPVTWDFLGRICYPQAPWLLGSLSTSSFLIIILLIGKIAIRFVSRRWVSLSSASAQGVSSLPNHKTHLLFY